MSCQYLFWSSGRDASPESPPVSAPAASDNDIYVLCVLRKVVCCEFEMSCFSQIVVWVGMFWRDLHHFILQSVLPFLMFSDKFLMSDVLATKLTLTGVLFLFPTFPILSEWKQINSRFFSFFHQPLTLMCVCLSFQTEKRPFLFTALGIIYSLRMTQFYIKWRLLSALDSTWVVALLPKERNVEAFSLY